MEEQILKEDFYDQSIVVGSLPHPISMFLLGMFSIIIIVVLVDHYRLIREFKKVTKDFDELKNQVKNNEQSIDLRIKEVSKKIDSRVDKALVGFKK